MTACNTEVGDEADYNKTKDVRCLQELRGCHCTKSNGMNIPIHNNHSTLHYIYIITKHSELKYMYFLNNLEIELF